jgi:hypothetical protein
VDTPEERQLLQVVTVQLLASEKLLSKDGHVFDEQMVLVRRLSALSA